MYKNVKKDKNGLWLKIDFQSIILDSKIEKSNKPFSYWNNSHWHFYDCYEVIFFYHSFFQYPIDLFFQLKDYLNLISLRRSLILIPFDIENENSELCKEFLNIIIGLLQMVEKMIFIRDNNSITNNKLYFHIELCTRIYTSYYIR